jgi:predicted permease
LTVGPSYFETLQIPILLGRPIDRRDVNGAPLVAVVNEVLAAQYFPGQNPIGRTFRLGASEAGELTIVGVARNVRYSSLKQATPTMAFLPYRQDIVKRPPVGMTFELRTAGDPLALAQTVRQALRQIAPQVPITRVTTHVQRIDATITQERTFANLCAAFAALALIIAGIGLYGTMAYAVSRRTNEIGIRMALGAKQRSIVWMVLREVFALAGAGLLIGLGCAWSLFSAVRSFVFGMKPGDPSTLLLAAGILAGALILAGWFPATRAARINPLAALRHE